MILRRNTLIIALAMAALPCVAWGQSVTFSIDLDASTTDIETTRTINAGESIEAALVLQSDGQVNLTGYELGIGFDATSITQGPLSLSGFDAAFNTIPTNGVNSPPFVDRSPFFMTTRPVGPEDTVFNRIGELSFDTPSDSATSPGTFASFEAGTNGRGLGGEFFSAPIFRFTLTGTNGTDPLADNVFVNFGDGDGFVFDSTFAGPDDSRAGTFGARLSVNSTVIPEPSSVACLLVAGVAGLVRRRRR